MSSPFLKDLSYFWPSDLRQEIVINVFLYPGTKTRRTEKGKRKRKGRENKKKGKRGRGGRYGKGGGRKRKEQQRKLIEQDHVTKKIME